MLGGVRGAPLSVILDYDEITPGDVLRPDNKRKMHAIYFSFRNFPQEFLRSSEAWLPLGILRSKTVNRFKGEFAGAMKWILCAVVNESTLADGVVIELSAGPRLVMGGLSNNLADGAALKAAFECKGAAGNQPCISCKNVVANSFEKTLREDDYLVTLSCSDVSRLDTRTSFCGAI